MKNTVEKLSFRDYRNLCETTMEFVPGINVIYGNNGMGKTNILEAVYLCSSGRSHRTHKISSLINFEKQSADVVLYKNNGLYNDKINISIRQNEKKGIAINGIPLKKTGELFGKFRTVIFSPEDMGLINDGPSGRRRFMDMELCQLSKVYCYDLEKYFKVLKNRNNLLKNGDPISIRDTVFIWDKQMAEYGVRIIEMREEFIKKISPFVEDIYRKLSGGAENIEISYKPETPAGELAERLEKGLERDIYYKKTNCGPHKDDIVFKINGSDVRLFGSQGQKRSTVLALKLSEIKLIREETGDTPVLLLDDVMSELDRERQKFVTESMKGMQILITCTGIDDFIEKLCRDKKNKVFFVKNGKISVKS